MPENFVYIDGKFYKKPFAKISVFDHGLLYGDGVFETMISGSGVVFKLDAHIDRFFASARLINLNIPIRPEGMKKIIYRTLAKNKLLDAYIRLAVTRGSGEIGLSPSLCPEPTIFIIVNKLKNIPDSAYKKGVKIIISKTRKNIPEALNPQIKSANFLNNILAKIEADRDNAFEAIMLNSKGFITEGTVSNVFFVRKGVLKTPGLKSGILSGITRSAVLELAAISGIETEQGFYRPEDLYEAEEIFLTNTSAGVLPVSKIGKFPVSGGFRLTSLLRSLYLEHLNNSCRKKPHRS